MKIIDETLVLLSISSNSKLPMLRHHSPENLPLSIDACINDKAFCFGKGVLAIQVSFYGCVFSFLTTIHNSIAYCKARTIHLQF